MSSDVPQGYGYDPFGSPSQHSFQQHQDRFHTHHYTQTPQRIVERPHHDSNPSNFLPSIQMQSPSSNTFASGSHASLPFSNLGQGYISNTSSSGIDSRFGSGGVREQRVEGIDRSGVPGIVPWQRRMEVFEEEENDAHSQFSERIRRGSLVSRTGLYDDDDGTEGPEEEDFSEDEDMVDQRQTKERSEKAEGDQTLGRNVGAMLDEDWETESDNPSDNSTAPSGESSAGSRWRGWETRTLLKSMFDLNVLDPNLKGHERDKIWIQVMQAVNTERKQQNLKGTRTDGACKHAWQRVFKAHRADQKISEIASGTDEEEGKWQTILDDLAALWNDVKEKGKKGKGKKEKEKCPSEKMRDQDLKELKNEKEKDSDEEEELDADVSLTPRPKKKGRQAQSTQIISERTQGMIDAFSDMATKQQEAMVRRLKQEEDMHKAELAAMEQLRQEDRMAEDRRHDDLVMLEREKLKVDRQKTNESLQRMRQVEDKLNRYQQETTQRHEELQRDVRRSLQGQDDLKAMMTTLLQRFSG
ncbi:hypothetical protein CF319_g8220 [Tilletia indica]|nr:hypothetical protein CF319_g8220 [Tilletia indica]